MNMKLNIKTEPADDQSFAIALGITTAREQEIEGIIQKHYLLSEGNDLDAIMGISCEVHNPNELAYAMLLYGICAGSANTEENMWNRLVA